MLNFKIHWLGLLLGCLACSNAFCADAKSATDTLLEIADSYYDYDVAGLNRVSCYVKSPEVLEEFDYSTKRAISQTKYEMVMVPGKSIDVAIQEVANRKGPDVSLPMLAFGKKMERWLNELMNHLITFPKTIHPKRGLQGYDIQWIEGEEGKKMTIKRVSQIMGAAQGDRNVREAVKDAIRNRIEKVRNNNVQRNAGGRKGKGRVLTIMGGEENVGRVQIPNAEVEIKLEGQRLEIHLDRLGKISMLLIENEGQRQEVRIKTKKIGKSWLLEDLDNAKFDEQDRLIERNLISYNYTVKSGIPVVRKITLKTIDAKGKLIDRRDDPNPVSVEMSSHMVEVRK